MSRPTLKFIVDTQLFIDALRDRSALERFRRFREACAPFEYLSVIVAQELRAGIKTPADRTTLDRHVLEVFERTGRTITPTASAWHRSGDVLAAMAKREGLQLAHLPKAFANDVMLAISCRESGCVLVTENVRDFARIRRFVAFNYVEPWPA